MMLNKLIEKITNEVDERLNRRYGILYNDIKRLSDKVDYLSKYTRELKDTSNYLIPNFNKIHELRLELERKEERLSTDRLYSRTLCMFPNNYTFLTADEKRYIEFRIAEIKEEIEKLKKGESKVDE